MENDYYSDVLSKSNSKSNSNSNSNSKQSPQKINRGNRKRIQENESPNAKGYIPNIPNSPEKSRTPQKAPRRKTAKRKTKKGKKGKKVRIIRPNKFDREARFLIGGCRKILKDRLHIRSKNVPEEAQHAISDVLTQIRDQFYVHLSSMLTGSSTEKTLDLKMAQNILKLTPVHLKICLHAIEIQQAKGHVRN